MLTRSVFILSGLAVLGATLMPSIHADTWNKKTVLTLNEAIQMPHVVLQPGKYVFKLLDSLSDRHIVQIFNADESHLITTILAIPNYRLQPTGETKFQFWETPAGQPKVMRAWFYPGDNFGQEFAYPKSIATQIAKITNTSVPTIVADAAPETAELKSVPVVVVDATGNETPVTKETILVAKNEAPAAAAASAEPAQVAFDASAPKKLPETASPYPFIGLIGFASLAASKLVARFSTRA